MTSLKYTKAVASISVAIIGTFLWLKGPEQSNLSAKTLASNTKNYKKFKSLNSSSESSRKNWGLNADTGVNAYAAWKITKGSPDIMVAVVDTGIDVNHPDLKDSLWENPGETGLDKLGKNKATNGIDDDGDGLIDNVNGWDFVTKSNINSDFHGHGTHIAGIIAGKINLDQGVGGVSPKVKIAAYRYYDEETVGQPSKGKANLTNTIAALNLAVKQGAKIINYSGGGAEFSEEEYKAMKLAESKGILIVAAAGNERSNSDLQPHYYYPCAYSLSNVICVASVDSSRHILSSSNWGVNKVDVAAPGEAIISTFPISKGSYGALTGTSQATAFVTGTAALVWSKNPSLTASEVKAIILNTVDKEPQLKGKAFAQGVVNAESAVKAAFNQEKMVSYKKEIEISEDPDRSISSSFKKEFSKIKVSDTEDDSYWTK